MAPGQKIEMPLGVCLPPNDLYPPPPSDWVQRLGNTVRETRLSSGGHFTAMEVGDAFVSDLGHPTILSSLPVTNRRNCDDRKSVSYNFTTRPKRKFAPIALL